MFSSSTVRALVLTGGRSRRFGGVHKPGVPVGGTPVLTRVHIALTAAAVDGIWVCGPLDGLAQNRRAGVRQVFERPRYSGPLAGIAAAVADMPEDPQAVVLVLAGDVPFTQPEDLALLVGTCASTGRAVSCEDADGRLQNLCAAWPDSLLRARLAAIGDPADTAVRRLWEGIDPVLVTVSADSVADFDTAEDYRRITGMIPPSGPRADPRRGGGSARGCPR